MNPADQSKNPAPKQPQAPKGKNIEMTQEEAIQDLKTKPGRTFYVLR